MTDAEWLRGIVASGWNDDLFSPEVKEMFMRVAEKLDAVPPPLVWSTPFQPPVAGSYWVEMSGGARGVWKLKAGFDTLHLFTRMAGPLPEPVEPAS